MCFQAVTPRTKPKATTARHMQCRRFRYCKPSISDRAFFATSFHQPLCLLVGFLEPLEHLLLVMETMMFGRAHHRLLDTFFSLSGKAVFVGHCCESGDLLSPDPSDAELLAQRLLLSPKVGDTVVIGGCGAYCSSMSAKHYNSFPEAPEAMVCDAAALCITFCIPMLPAPVGTATSAHEVGI